MKNKFLRIKRMKKPFSLRVLRKAKMLIAFRTLICIIVRGAFLLIPIIFGTCINYITKGMYFQAIVMILIGLFIACFARVFEIIMTYSWHRLHEKLFAEYTKLSSGKLFDEKARANIGETLNILNNDINVMASFFPDLIRQIISVLETIVIFIYFFSVGFYFGFASISATAICLIIIDRTNRKITKVNEIRLKAQDERISILNKILSSKKENKESKKNLISITEDFVKKLTKARVTEDKVLFGNLIVIEIFRWGLLILGIYLMSKDRIELGVLIIIYNYYSQLIAAFWEISSIVILKKRFDVSEYRFIKFLKNK